MAAVNRPLWALAALLLVAAPEAPRAQERLQLIEQQIKAGLLSNFLKYTEWPDDHPLHTGAALVCLYGGDPFGGQLASMAGRTVNQSVIAVRTVAHMQELDACALIVVDAGQALRWTELRAALSGKSVLTVSDFSGFAPSGGMIEFIHVGDRIGIEINAHAVAAARLEVQDRLLDLARAIHTGAPEP